MKPQSMQCINKSVHDPNSNSSLILVQFKQAGGMGTLHWYLPTDEAEAYKLGAKYELTLTQVK